MGGDVDKLPPAFITALEISAIDHMKMVAAVAPFIDTSISKTVNVPPTILSRISKTCIPKPGRPD